MTVTLRHIGPQKTEDHKTPKEHILVSDQEKLNIIQRLHCSLDPTKVLSNFLNATSNTLNFSSCLYQNDSKQQALMVGSAQRHSCQFELGNHASNFGRVTITKKQCFSKQDVGILEELLEYLIQPLYNALTHQCALKASLLDALTGAGNRVALEAELVREVALANRHQEALSILVLDIDRFKTINDNYGHAAGDKILRDVSKQIAICTRRTDATYRYGGEEFVVILNKTNLRGAYINAERIRQHFAKVNRNFKDQTIKLTVSIGLASWQKNESPESLFDRADQALYQAKSMGRNRVVVAEQFDGSGNSKQA